MEVVDFFQDKAAWSRDELFYPLRRFFGPLEGNPFNDKSNVEIRAAFLEAIHADPNPVFQKDSITALVNSLLFEAERFRADFESLLPRDFRVLLFPMKSSWEFVMKHLDGTWGVTFPNCIVLAAHPQGKLMKLQRTLHHESNHSIRLKFIPDDHCFLDRIILEGLAEAYVDEKFSKDPPSKYVSSVSESEIKAWIPRLAEFWLDEDFRFERYKSYLYGSEAQEIPRWLGYGVGYQLVKSARLAHLRGIAWEQLIQIPAKRFLAS